jgi:ferredoxin
MSPLLEQPLTPHSLTYSLTKLFTLIQTTQFYSDSDSIMSDQEEENASSGGEEEEEIELGKWQGCSDSLQGCGVCVSECACGLIVVCFDQVMRIQRFLKTRMRKRRGVMRKVKRRGARLVRTRREAVTMTTKKRTTKRKKKTDQMTIMSRER